MKAFNLEKALAGEKVVTRDGREVTELHSFVGNANNTIFGVVDGGVDSWVDNGKYHDLPKQCGADLLMVPTKLIGFVNVFNDGRTGIVHSTKQNAENAVGNNRKLAIIDLSQFNEGHSLD